MIVNISHAEEDICHELKTIEESSSNKYILHYKKNGDHNYIDWDIVHLQMVVNNISKLLKEDDNLKLYFFHDGDIGILIPNKAKDKIDKIKLLLHDIFINDKNIKYSNMLYNTDTDIINLNKIFNKKNEHWESLQENTTKKPASKKIKTKIDKNYAQQLLNKRLNRKGIHILLVEDEPFTLKLIEGILNKNTIIKATNGFDAVESYMLNAPDIVFLDINLPDIDGHQVLKHIHEFDENCYVIMLSGNTLLKDVSYSLNKGATGFVVKPFPKEKLLSYVELYKSLKEERKCLHEAI